MTHDLDLEVSIEVARRIGARFRRCWTNSTRALRWLPEGSLYVEGWVVVHSADPFVIEHGWCEVAGRIVDPTYTEVVSDLERPLVYVPGIRLIPAEATEALRTHRLPAAWHRHEPGYSEAFELAMREVARRRPAEQLPRTQVVNCRREPCDIFIGRPSTWGNPFRIPRDGAREQVIEKYRQWVIRQPMLLRALPSLRGKILGCDCSPDPCHGDVLVELTEMLA